MFVLGFLAAVTLSQTATPPSARPVRLTYERVGEASACPDEAALRSAVASRLGFDAFDEKSRASLHVTVTRAASGSGFDARLELTDELGSKKSRALSGTQPDCADLHEVLALSLAVALEAFTSTPPPAIPGPPPEKKIEPPPEAPFLPFASLGGALAIGAAPTATGVTFVGGGLRRGLLSLALEVRFQVPAGVGVETGRIDVAAVSAEFRPCLAIDPVRVCGLGAGGAMWSWATGLAAARTAVTPLIALGGHFDFSVHLGWKVWLVALAELRGAIAQTALNVGTTQVWVTPPVSGVFGLALDLRTDSVAHDK